MGLLVLEVVDEDEARRRVQMKGKRCRDSDDLLLVLDELVVELLDEDVVDDVAVDQKSIVQSSFDKNTLKSYQLLKLNKTQES